MTTNLLFYDCETTGLPHWLKPSNDPIQPHIVQLTALLTDAAGAKQASIDLIIRPAGWTIPDDMTVLHGIDTARADAAGVPLKQALDVFLAMHSQASMRIAHNESFDARMLRIEIMRAYDRQLADGWKAGQAACTMRMATPIMNLPPTDAMAATGRRTPKAPKLTEAFSYFVGGNLDGAHNAMVDVLACKRVYFAILAKQGTPAPTVDAPPRSALRKAFDATSLEL